MEKLFKSLLSIREIKLTTDDDYVDRLSRQYTMVMLVCFAFLVSTKQFVGRPISCWCPAQFTDSHRDYANKALRYIVNQMDRYLLAQREYRQVAWSASSTSSRRLAALSAANCTATI
jgi:Arc/MetJ family transcription regulator